VAYVSRTRIDLEQNFIKRESQMKKTTLLALFAVAAIILPIGTASVSAATVTIDIAPNQIPDESTPLVNTGDAPTGYGPDSWQNCEKATSTSKVNWHARYNSDGDYLSALFGTKAATLTINDIASISYWTKRPDGTAITEDWAAYIYTRPDGINDKKSWYGYCFINNYNEHSNIGDWTQYTTDTGMTFRDQAGNAGYFSGKDLGYLKANYGTELVEMISVQTMSNYANFNGYMDGLSITLADGSVGNVNFVPEPATMAVLGLGGLLLRRRMA
jgi:hypothetical protein